MSWSGKTEPTNCAGVTTSGPLPLQLQVVMALLFLLHPLLLLLLLHLLLQHPLLQRRLPLLWLLPWSPKR